MGLKTTLSILRFEFHALGAGIIAALLMAGMFYLFGNSEQDFAVLVSFAVLVFLVSLVRIDLGLAILIIGMLFSPEAIVGQAHRRIVTIRAEDLLIVALMAAWVVRSVLLGMAVRSTPLNVPILLFVIAAGISTLGGIALPYFVDPVEAAFYVGKLIEFFAVYFFAVHFIEDEKRLHLFLGLFLLVGAAVSLYGLSQVGEVRRITAPFEGSVPEPNTFGGYLMTVIGLCIPFAVFTPYASLRFLLLAIAGIAFTALLYTLSRASFIALVGMFIVLGMLTKSRMMWLAFFIFLLVHRVILPPEVFDRVNYTFQSPSGVTMIFPFEIPFVGSTVQVDKSTFERIGVWEKVFFTWTLNPYHFLFGWGITRLHILDSQFARFLVEVGFVGTSLFIWILYRIYSTAWWLKENSTNWVVKSYAIGYLAVFFGVLIHSLGTITFYIVRIMEPFWFLTGILVWWYLKEQEVLAEEREEGKVRPKVWQPDLPWRQVDA